LRGRYALGDDAYDPHDNVLAGTAYLREMYNIYGFRASWPPTMPGRSGWTTT